ncbi:SDR family NAD(P)-dependent oxidoreductase [Archangium violaceum]|uniref:SDR family NAD(P)-dependent oxidoreductase n=1 Tax=Archangium violaceum TaxID=83451 RepID=UPI001EF13AA6|nr:SDR family oxidoreductase [Archangium violaceum]
MRQHATLLTINQQHSWPKGRTKMGSVSNKGKAVITGASSGIGAEYALQLAVRGYDLILVARNRARLDALAARLNGMTGRQVEVVEADLVAPEGVRRVEEVLRSDPHITLLVNNAGVGAVAPLLESDPDKMSEMIAINVLALTRLTMAAAPGFVSRGGGTIINIASIVAIKPELLNGVYGGTKAFVVAYTQSLHHELRDKGARVQAVLPGATRTEFWDIAGAPVHTLPNEIVMSASDMVGAALAGLDQGELVTIPSLPEFPAFRSKSEPSAHETDEGPVEEGGRASRTVC